MTQTQFVEQEVKNYIKFLFPKVSEKQLDERFKESDYGFNEELDRILIDIRIGITKYKTIIMGWSDMNGIYGLEDEDRDFDEKF
jgi:hypothetical protein